MRILQVKNEISQDNFTNFIKILSIQIEYSELWDTSAVIAVKNSNYSWKYIQTNWPYGPTAH